MKVGVSIVNYFGGQDLIRVIDAYLRQEEVRVELVVCNNSSGSDLEAKNRYSSEGRVVWLEPGINLGFSVGHNRAMNVLMLSEVDFIVCSNFDITFNAMFLRDLTRIYVKNKVNGILAPLNINPNKDSFWRYPSALRLVASHCFIGNSLVKITGMKITDIQGIFAVDCVSGGCFIVNKTVWNELGGFHNDYFLYSEELYLYQRLRELNLKMYVTAEVKYSHGDGDDQNSYEQLSTLKRHLYNSRRLHLSLFHHPLYCHLLDCVHNIHLLELKILSWLKKD